MAKEQVQSLSSQLSQKAKFKAFKVWLVGDTPLITHAWSQKAKLEMLSKQVKATKPGREQRNPEQDFVDSLYDMGDGVYGFPVTGIKKCILSVAHKDKGIARTDVRSSIWLDAEMVRVRPAVAGAICDMPLVRIHGGKPEMREDMVRIGVGLRKTANLAYRGQFTVWAIRLTGRFNPTVLPVETVAFLTQTSGMETGIGEWRNEKDGIFGSFHVASIEEERAWEAYASGKGKLPLPDSYQQAAE